MSVSRLFRRWRSVPLPMLSQGSTLSIKSNLVRGPVHVWIHPEWRDSGHAELKEILEKGDPKSTEVEMIVSNEDALRTSLGRLERHISIQFSDRPASLLERPSTAADDGRHQIMVPVMHCTPHKAVEKVILDDGSVHPDAAKYAPPPAGLKRVEYHDGYAHITQLSGGGADDLLRHRQEHPGVHLKVQVPEKVNVVCDLMSDGAAGGSIMVSGKIEGDVRLLTTDGDISVTKLRGHRIELACGAPTNAIYCKELLESQSLTIHSAGRVRVKQVHGQSVSISVDPAPVSRAPHEWQSKDDDDEGSLVDISALFVSSGGGGASIRVRETSDSLARRAVRVKSHHGPLEVTLSKAMSRPKEMDPYTNETYPLVELGGVNGSCEVAVTESAFDRETTVHEGWTSCSIHFDSLLPESVSLITADRGDVSITLDRKVESDLRLLSAPDESCLMEAGALLADEDDSEVIRQVLREIPGGPDVAVWGDDRVLMRTKSFTRKKSHSDLGRDDLAYEEGWVDNQSREPDSRFDRKSRGEGKIRLDGAASQALKYFSNRQEDEANNNSETDRPLIAVASTRRIRLETVSWIGAIARRYGLGEDHRGLGRTASRRGRSILPIESEPRGVQ